MNKNVSNSSVLIVGSIAYDTIKTPFGEIDNALGGSGTYFSLTSSLFSKTQIVGVVGEDFKKADEQLLLSHGVDISGIEHQAGKTFRWGGEYSFDLNNRTTLFTELNVLENFDPKLSENHKQAEYVFLGNTHPSVQKKVLEQMTQAKFIGLDTMNFWIEKTPNELKEVLKLTDCLIINDSEAREFSKEHNLVKAAKKIMGAMGEKESKTLIIKRGEYGLLMFNKNEIFHLPGYPLEDVVDPTGAGDSFAGGFMGFLAKTQDSTFENLKRACVYGSVTASFCCEKLGTNRLQEITAADINQRFKEFKQLTQFETL